MIFRSLLEELSLLAARALSLGEEAAHVLARIATIAGVVLVGWLGYRLITVLVRRLLRPLAGATEHSARAQRAQTLGPLLTSVARYLMAFLVGVVVLQQIGIDVRAVLVSAGVVGVGIGLGAQSLIRDVIMGFFILLENLVAVGDVIEVGPHTGVVESVGLRVTKLRKFSGELRIVPNGELAAFGHHTAGWARVVVEVAVDYDEDVNRALRVLGEVGKAMADARPAVIFEPPTAEGILRFGPGSGQGEAVLTSPRPRRCPREGSARVRDPPSCQGSVRRAWHSPPARRHGGPSRLALRGRGRRGRTKGVGRMSVRTAVFPAAGLGTRFLPATKAQPKEMLPLVDKPMIQYVVEEAVAAGLDRVCIVTGRGKRAIEDHFDASVELEFYLQERGKWEELAQIKTISDLASVTYVRQKEPLGLGHAILCARPLVGDEPFAAFLGDDIIVADPPAISQLLSVYEQFGNPVLAVERVPRDQLSMYGVIKGTPVADNVYLVEDLVEKPSPEAAPSDLAIIGRYVLTPDIFPILGETPPDHRGEIQLTDALRRLRARRPLYAVRFTGRRFDTGDKLGFLKATVEMALARPDLGDAFRAYIDTVR